MLYETIVNLDQAVDILILCVVYNIIAIPLYWSMQIKKNSNYRKRTTLDNIDLYYSPNTIPSLIQ
ncbi:MAG: hypothetical protein HRT87_04560 [Legionellales bacterium]|nr:hypothetical protein [Legionellales bacterium]